MRLESLARSGSSRMASRRASPMISNCLSTAERSIASRSKSARLLPEVNSSSRRQACKMSKRYLRVSGRLKQDYLSVADRLLEVGIAAGSFLDQIHRDRHHKSEE